MPRAHSVSSSGYFSTWWRRKVLLMGRIFAAAPETICGNGARRVPAGGVALGIAQHAGQLVDAVLAVHRAHVAGGDASAGSL